MVEIDIRKALEGWMPDTCPTCGSRVRVVGNVTMHYEPVTGADVASLLALCEQAEEENRNLQLTVTELQAAVDSMKRLEAQRYKSAANAFGLTPPSERTHL